MRKDLKELGIAIAVAGSVVGALESYEALRFALTGNPLSEEDAQEWRAVRAALALMGFLVTVAVRAKST